MIAKAILIAAAALLAIQDFKDKKVSLYLLLTFGLVSVYTFYKSPITMQELGMNVGYIVTFLGLTFLSMTFLSNKKWTELIGSADIIFLFLLAPLFFFQDLVLLVVVMMIFSLLTHVILKFFNLIKSNYIPLVGYMAVLLITVMIKSLF